MLARLFTACGCTKELAIPAERAAPPPYYDVPLIQMRTIWETHGSMDESTAQVVKRRFVLYDVQSPHGYPIAFYRERV